MISSKKKHSTHVKHDLAFKNPFELDLIIYANKTTIWSLINLSNNLQITDINLTSLILSDLFLEPFLNSGMMFAS